MTVKELIDLDRVATLAIINCELESLDKPTIANAITELINAEIERQSAPVKDILDDLNELSKDDDWEKAHIKADVLLCELLLYLGHEEVVDAWERVGKWYA